MRPSMLAPHRRGLSAPVVPAVRHFGKSGSSKRWLARQQKDPYAAAARNDPSMRSRAHFKV